MRHVQLIAISGSIGAALFVSIGSPLTSAGPLGLLIGVCFWSFVVFCASNCLIEMTTLLPLDGGFISFAERFVDKSFAMALGWNVSATLCGRFEAEQRGSTSSLSGPSSVSSSRPSTSSSITGLTCTRRFLSPPVLSPLPSSTCGPSDGSARPNSGSVSPRSSSSLASCFTLLSPWSEGKCHQACA